MTEEKKNIPSCLMDCDKLTEKKHGTGNLLEKSIEEYYYDKIEQEIGPFHDFYSRLAYAPSTELEKARHTMACLDNILVQARFDWNEKKKSVDDRWKHAVQWQKDIIEGVPKFNSYFLDSIAKRNRSVRQEEKELEQISEKQREISRLEKERNVLRKVRDDLEFRLDKFSLFKTYLERVKGASQGEYGDVREIIDRYAVLAEARSTLMGRNDGVRDTVQIRLKSLENDIIMKANEVLAYRNLLSELMEYQHALQGQVLRLEDSLLKIKTTAAKRTLVIGQIKMAIRNLYLQLCKQMRRHVKVAADDTLGQLADIKISVREMWKLTRDIKHMLKAASVAAEMEAKARLRQQMKTEERALKLARLNKAQYIDPRQIFGLSMGDGKPRFYPLPPDEGQWHQ